MEVINSVIGQQQPRGTQVTGRVTCTHIAKVDDAAEVAVSRQDVGRVQVRMKPHRRTCPVGSGERITPNRTHLARIVYQPAINCLAQEACNACVGRCEWPAAAVAADGCIARRGLVKRRQESGLACGAGPVPTRLMSPSRTATNRSR